MSKQSKSTKRSKIYFVTSKTRRSKEHCSENMMRAYNKCLEYGMEPVWISRSDSNKLKLTISDILVVENCDQIPMKKLAAKCCIIQPEHLPFFSSATPGRSLVHTTVMKGLCICITRLSLEDKRYVQVLVTKMSGNFTTELDDKVTHLVTLSVLSDEYEKAIHMKIPIVTKEWVIAIWEANKTDYVEPGDKRFDKYKIPMFYNLVVTATNIQRCEKEEISRLIRNNGGVYMGDLKLDTVNLVLTPENSPISQKLKYAKVANITCLTLNWLYESIKVGYALPFRYYIFQTVKQDYSSRRSNVRETRSCPTTSFITYDKQRDNYIDETAFKTSTTSNVSTVSTVTTVLDRPMFNEAEAAGPFLFGCIIYLAGFTSDQRVKLNRILNVGSAMRFDYICDIITHVIVGDEDSAASELKLLKSKGLCPYILKLEWLEESIRLKRSAPVEFFLYEQENSIIQKNLQLLQERMLEKGEESFNLDQQEQQNAIVSITDEMVQEYVEPYIPVLSQMPESLEYLMLPGTDNSDIINDRLFEGLTFVVSTFCNNDVVENIVAMNGRVVPGTFVEIPDYGIVPKYGTTLDCTVKEIVTDLYIEDCLNHNRIVEIMYYHRPVSVTKHVLVGCVLTVSRYIGVERSYLVTLAMELGAIYQNVLAREMIINRDIYRNTHLICSIPNGRKYDAAVRWKIPVVSAEWLKVCAAQSTRVDVTPFLVVKSLSPERPMGLDISLPQTNTNQIILSTEPVASSSRSHNIIVPEEYFPNLQIQNNNFDNMVSLNNELSLSMNTTSKPSETLCSQVFEPICAPETERSRLEGISYSSNLIKEEPPLGGPFTKALSILKKNCQEENEKLPENHNADETLPAAAKDGFN